MRKNQDGHMANLIFLNKQAYNKVARLFSSTREYLWDDLKEMGKWVKTGDKMLDLGCGNGRLLELCLETIRIAERASNIKYVGLDQSEKMIEIARKKYPGQTFIFGEMTELPFAEDSFDVIFCIAAFCHLPKDNQVLALCEMRRVLRPGGYLVMTNWNASNHWVQNKVRLGKYTTSDQKNFLVPWRNGPGEVLATRYYYGFGTKELEELFSHSGFEVVEQYYVKKGKKTSVETGENLVSIVL